MLSSKSKTHGFTISELLVVIAIIAILAGLLLPVIISTRVTSKKAAAKIAMRAIVMALEKYREDFESYPPNDSPSTNGSEVLWYHLCRRMKPMVKTTDGKMIEGEVHRGPYMQAPDMMIVNSGSGGGKKLVSPLGGDYTYSLQIDPDGQKRNCLVVDPGEDKLLGGTVSPNSGFTSNGGDANGDGYPDDEDNIYSSVQIKK